MGEHGGKRQGAGRPKGVRNKATEAQKTTLSDLARSYTDLALATLAEVARSGTSDAARVSAACAILDRGYGRPRPEPEATVDADSAMTQWLQEINVRGSRAPLVGQEDLD